MSLPIFDCRFLIGASIEPIENLKPTIGNNETHPLLRGGALWMFCEPSYSGFDRIFLGKKSPSDNCSQTLRRRPSGVVILRGVANDDGQRWDRLAAFQSAESDNDRIPGG